MPRGAAGHPLSGLGPAHVELSTMENQAFRAAGALAAVYSLRLLGQFMIDPVFLIYARHLDGARPYGWPHRPRPDRAVGHHRAHPGNAHSTGADAVRRAGN